jgi:hypothetical protein
MTETSLTPELTPSEAATKLETLGADEAWRVRFLAGDGPAVQEFHQLMSAKHKADRIESVMNGTASAQPLETVMPGEISTHNLMLSVADLRSIGLRDVPLRDFLEGKPITKADRALVEDHERRMLGSAEWRAKYLSGDAEARTNLTAIKMAKLRPVKD